MAWSLTRARGRLPTTAGCAGNGSRARRSRSRSRSRTRRCCRQRHAVTCLTGDRRACLGAAVRRHRWQARLSARHRVADRARADGRDRRLAAVPAAVAGTVSRPDTERGLERRAAPARRDHQDRQHPRPPAAGRSGLAPAAAAASERDTRAAPARTTGRGPRTRRPKRQTPAPSLARARRPRQTTHSRRGRRRTRARRTPLGARDHVGRPRQPASARRAHRRKGREE